MDDTPKITGYTIESCLGSGAMATVYLAVQQNLERRVALKLMAPSLVADVTFRERFLREGKVIAQLNHPNIVTIYDIGVEGNNYYMAMEYVSGGMTLKERIGDLSDDDAATILVQIASALDYAHKRNFVHRDVKPANILFSDNGSAVLSDFGIAKTLGEATQQQLTQEGFAVGTPAYMSPEQILGKAVDARSDLYSLGVVFHEMLTGEKPYQASETFALALMHVNEAIPRLPAEQQQWQPLIDCLMAKEPADRFADAAELAAAVREIRAGNTQTLTAQGTPKPLPNSQSTIGDTIIVTGETPVPTTNKKTLPPIPKQPAKWPTWVLSGGAVIALLGIGIYLFLPPPAPPRCEPSELTADQKVQIARLLENANLNNEFGRWVFPPVSNAAYLYDQVLKIDQCNDDALKGLKAIAAKIIQAAEQSLSENANLQDALAQVEEALLWQPDDADLQSIKQKLAKKLQ